MSPTFVYIVSFLVLNKVNNIYIAMKLDVITNEQIRIFNVTCTKYSSDFEQFHLVISDTAVTSEEVWRC